MRHRTRRNCILGFSISLLLLSGLFQQQPVQAAVEQEAMLNALQEQLISFRKEFKLRIERAEEDRLSIHENLQAKLKDLLNTQGSLQTVQPELSEKTRELQTLLDSYQTQIDQLERSLDLMEQTMNENLDTIAGQLSNVKPSDFRPRSQARSAQPDAQDQPSQEGSENGGSFEFAPGQLFRAAYRIYMEGDYDVAIAGFQKYLEEYPETQLAGAAQYWIAESLAKLGEPELAIQEYERLITAYPQNDKVADAYYGIGVALLSLNQAGEARSRFLYVVDHFAGTIAAQKAQTRLKEFQ